MSQKKAVIQISRPCDFQPSEIGRPTSSGFIAKFLYAFQPKTDHAENNCSRQKRDLEEWRYIDCFTG